MSSINRRQSSDLVIIPAPSYGAAFQYSWTIKRGLLMVMHHSNPRQFVWRIIALLINLPTVWLSVRRPLPEHIFPVVCFIIQWATNQFYGVRSRMSWLCSGQRGGSLQIVITTEVKVAKITFTVREKSKSRTCRLYNNCANPFVTRQWITWYI